jgi:hypothetical protein
VQQFKNHLVSLTSVVETGEEGVHHLCHWWFFEKKHNDGNDIIRERKEAEPRTNSYVEIIS